MITVLHVSSYSSLYGANRSLLDLVDGLKDHGVRSIVLAPSEGDLTVACRRNGVQCIIRPFETWVSLPPRYDGLNFSGVSGYRRLSRFFGWSLFSLRQRLTRSQHLRARWARNRSQARELANALSDLQIDIVHTHSAVNPFGWMLARHLSLRHVWHLREFVDLDYGYRFDPGKAKALRTIRQSSATVCISNAISRYYKVREGRSTVIYNGVLRLARFLELREDSIKEITSRVNIFAIVGLLHPGKMQSEAIEALALVARKHSDVRLLIAGGGEDELALRARACTLGIADKVEFLGYVSDPFEVYKRAGVVLMCSRHEAMGRVTVEAMAACRPVIGYDQAGTSELIQHRINGLLYRGGSESLAECMRELVENPKLAVRLAENAWHDAVKKYTTEAYSLRVYDVYRKVLA